ncbi:phosphotransferase [Rhizorhabdus argentea]|uniref:phosphotransferase n=1 Tax=Rhizorhabdus argentea TaxID=1387174 RepID=UPI0030EDE8CC
MEAITPMDSALDPDSLIRSWIEDRIGPVSRIERQGRWRPSWYVDALDGSEMRHLYVRGDRAGDWPPMPLKYECRVFELFGQKGLRVPKIHGFIQEIPAIVMDLAPGRPDLRTAHSEADRDMIRDQLIEQMVMMHAIDPDAMADIGALRPDGDDEAGLTYYRLIEKLFTSNRIAPAPAADFVRRWLNRNVPKNPDGARPITVDAGQFLFEGDRLTAMLDFEFAGLGDFHTDLAALRIRNRAEYIGDVEAMITLYQKHSGVAVDLHRVRYHTAMIAILTPLQVAAELARPTPEIDYHEYLVWDAFCTLIALDCIAEIMGWEELETPLPDHPRLARHATSLTALSMSLDAGVEEDEFAAYRRRKLQRTLRYIERADGWRWQFDAEYLDDVAALIGRRPSDWQEADAEIERVVAMERPVDEKALWRLLTRRYLRTCFLLADPEDQMNHEQITTRMKPIGAATGERR